MTKATAISVLGKLKALPKNWNGFASPMPNAVAFASVSKALEEVEGIPSLLSRLDRIIPNALGGISLYFTSVKKIAGGASARHISLQALNDGSLLLVTGDREKKADGTRVINVELGALDKSLMEAQTFLVSDNLEASTAV